MNEILYTQLMHPRDQIAMIISRIYKRGMTTTSGGNISVIDENGDIWVTPASVDKGSLRPSDIMCVKCNGTIFSAKSLVMAKPIGELLPISDNQVAELRKVFLKK